MSGANKKINQIRASSQSQSIAEPRILGKMHGWYTVRRIGTLNAKYHSHTTPLWVCEMSYNFSQRSPMNSPQQFFNITEELSSLYASVDKCKQVCIIKVHVCRVERQYSLRLTLGFYLFHIFSCLPSRTFKSLHTSLCIKTPISKQHKMV